jgi:hypothetical protein
MVLTTLNAGTLSQTIYSPFNHVVEKESDEYHSGITKDPVETLIDDRYTDFVEYSDDDIREPFCRIGGQYMINVYNDPSPGADPSNETFKLYYCKTTRDLLRKVRIPSDWVNSDLVVYCNDGKNVHSISTNFDYITTLLNTYKACIVKNMDLEEDNVIVYGYEVGNRIVDNDPAFFYNHNSSTGPVLVEFTPENVSSESWNLKKEIGGKALVPYFKETWEDCSTNSETGQEVCVEKCKLRPRTLDEALNWTQSNHDPLAQLMILKEHHPDESEVSENNGGNVAIGGTLSQDGASSMTCPAEPKSFSEYLYKIDVYYRSMNVKYSYGDNRSFYFDYDTGDHFYALSNFHVTFGDDTVPILDVFPFGDEIELSRVAFFKKQNNRYIYGYESAIKLLTEIFGSSVLPSYIIKLENFEGYSEDRCIKSLSSFNVGRSTIESNTEVVCDGDQIRVISNTLNSKDKGYIAFHLFKNIIMGLQ